MKQVRKIYAEFPPRFWAVVAVMFIDRIGGTLLWPFFALYITEKFSVGMTEAGLVLGLFSIFGLLGNILGGALTDRFGRRSLILFGLVFSAVSTLTLGLVNSLAVLYPLAVVIGTLSDLSGPAHQAMIADLLPEDKRQEGFGVMRVVANLSWIIGPTIGGIVATRSFFALFVIDALLSCTVALLFFLTIPETRPQTTGDSGHESLARTFLGYGQVLRDRAYLAFIFASVLMGLVYQQMYNSLSVFLRDIHGVDPQHYGYLMSTSAITVILFQFATTRRVKRHPPFLMMALGTLFYAVGFALFGVVGAFLLFAACIVIITIGEMIIMPVASALAAEFAPEDKRGRYMAIFGFSWSVPSIIGPTLAGLILDNYNPNLLWYLGGLLCVVSALSFVALHARLGRQARFAPAPAPDAAP